MTYIVRRNVHEDEALVLGPFFTLGEAVDALVGDFMEGASNVLACDTGRLYKLIEACEELASTGKALAELVDRSKTHDFAADTVLGHGPWEIHFSATENGWYENHGEQAGDAGT